MKKPKIKMQVLKEDKGYSAFVNIGKDFIGTQGNDFEELKANVLDAVNLYAQDKGFSYAPDEMQFELELPSFFEFYKVINAKALAERIGINQSLLAQYIKGIKKPSPNQTKRILMGVQQVGRELASVQFIM